MSNPLHSNKSAEWYTPKLWIDRVREVLGEIVLDPASCAEAQKTVRALHWYGREADGLSKRWEASTVFLNPPSGRGAAKAWFGKLLTEYIAGRVQSAVYLAYNLEQIRYLPTPRYSLIAVPNKRIAFVGAGSSPTHSNAFILLGLDSIRQRFIDVFSGSCKILQKLS